MSRLAPALRMRRRELDALALAIGAEQHRAALLAGAASALDAQRPAERAFTSSAPIAADAWFAAVASRLADLAVEGSASDRRLAALRTAAGDARARLSLLEEADAVAAAAVRRALDRKAQGQLDDCSAARIAAQR